MDKKITISSAKIVSLPKDGLWSQCFSFGNLHLALEIEGSQSFETSLLGKQILEEAQKVYLETESKDLELVKKILSLINEKKESTVGLNAAVCLQTGLILYLGALIGAKILIKRGSQILAILTGEKETETASGFLKENDRIILQTKHFSQCLNEQKLALTLNDKKPQEIAEILTPQVQAENKFTGAGMILGVLIEGELFSQKEIKKTEKEEERTIATEDLPEQEEQRKPLINFTNFKNNLLDKFKTFKEKLSIFSASRPIYIRGAQPEIDKKKRLMTTIALLLLILFITSIVFNLKKKTVSQTEKEFNDAYQIAIKKQEEAKALIDLNPNRSKTLLEESKEALLVVESKIAKNKKLKTKLDKLLIEINSELEMVTKVYRLKELSLFFDLTLIKDKAKGKLMTVDQDKIFIYDSVNNSLYQLNSQNKSQEILASGKDLANGLALSYLNERLFLLTDRMVYQVKLSGEDKREVITLKKEKEEIIDLCSFGSNLYLLDVKNKRIWKYIMEESTTVAIKNYLAEGINPDFSQSISMTVDGFIYVLRKDGEILKFIQGNPEGFKISGLDQNLKEPKKIYTTSDLKNIYLLDPNNQRVVVINKKGEYQSQYIHQDIGGVEDMVVSSDEKKIFLISGSKIYEIEVK